MTLLNQLFNEMILFDSGDPKRIQHFTKVHSYAKLIGEMEGMQEQELFILEAAAYAHDIGIHPAEEKYGRCDGKLQEQEGPAAAERMLRKLGFEDAVIERVCYLIGHHHTYQNIEGMDYQILVEADFLVNLYEDGAAKKTVEETMRRIFKTEAGKSICRRMFGINDGV